MNQPSHAKIDKAVHLVTKVNEHADGPHHTHRVHLACGLTVDVDIAGKKAHARHMERAEQHDAEHWREEHVRKAERALGDGEQWHHVRWTDHKSKATCDHCAAVETGAAQSITHERAHTQPRTVRADVSTGLPCPTCNAELRIRADGSVACVAHGHEFTVPEVLASSMSLLQRLATGGKE